MHNRLIVWAAIMVSSGGEGGERERRCRGKERGLGLEGGESKREAKEREEEGEEEEEKGKEGTRAKGEDEGGGGGIGRRMGVGREGELGGFAHGKYWLGPEDKSSPLSRVPEHPLHPRA